MHIIAFRARLMLRKMDLPMILRWIRMPPRLPDGESKKVGIVAPLTWIAKVNAWRRDQPGWPNFSEAVRQLVEIGIEATKGKGDKKPKPKP
jgi:hypothetical protein